MGEEASEKPKLGEMIMAIQFNETFRQYLPGAGKATDGSVKQGKTRVVGQIAVDTYTADGESLAPVQLGLSSIDAIQFRVRDETDRADGLSRTGVAYATDSEVFYLYSENSTGAKSTPSGDFTVEVIAEGDSAFDVELT